MFDVYASFKKPILIVFVARGNTDYLLPVHITWEWLLTASR